LIILSGLNGAGKTNFFTAIIFALLGQDDAFLHFRNLQRKSRHLAQREKELNSFLNHRAAQEGQRRATVTLDLDDLGHHFSVVRSWEYDPSGRFSGETLEVLRDGEPFLAPESGDQQAIYHDYLEGRVPPRVAPFFFFDGEQIQKLAGEDANEGLQRGVDSLLGFEIIRRLELDVERLHDSYRREAERLHQSEAEVVQLRREETRLQAEVDDLRAISAQVEHEAEEIREQVENHHHELRRLFGPLGMAERGTADDLVNATRRVEEELITLRAELERLIEEDILYWLPRRRQVRWVAANGVASTRDDTALESLVEKMFGPAAERPTPPLTADQGRFLSDLLRRSWREVTAPTVADSRPTLAVPLQEAELELLRARSLTMASRRAGRLRHVLNRIEALQRQADRQRAIPVESARTLLDRLRKLEFERGQKDREYDSNRRRIQALTNELQQLRANLSARKERVTESSTQDQLTHLAGKVRQALTRYQEVLRPRKCAELRQHLAHMYFRLARKEDMIKDIVLEPHHYRIRLLDRNGRSVPVHELSAGEKQIYAFSLLWALGRAARTELPVVIDTPLSRLDSVHRANLASHYFPAAGSQVLILSTDTEIDQDYFELLRPHVSRSYRLAFDTARHQTIIEPVDIDR
jgi:DNA sulfur modification protein DndD